MRSEAPGYAALNGDAARADQTDGGHDPKAHHHHEQKPSLERGMGESSAEDQHR